MPGKGVTVLVLGIESATRNCSAALVRDDDLLAETQLRIKNAHAKKLSRMIRYLLQETELSVEELEGIAVSIGPGSFTGLRIGLSLAKGIAAPRNLPLAAVPTLEALTAGAPVGDGRIRPVMKSRGGEYYTALYERTAYSDHLLEPVRLMPQEDLVAAISENETVIGEAAELIREKTASPRIFAYPTAAAVARLGVQRHLAGRHENIDTLEPQYMQDFIAGTPKKARPWITS